MHVVGFYRITEKEQTRIVISIKIERKEISLANGCRLRHKIFTHRIGKTRVNSPLHNRLLPAERNKNAQKERGINLASDNERKRRQMLALDNMRERER